jgi:hypothetical protein
MQEEQPPVEAGLNRTRELMLTGLIAIFLGVLPGWVIGNTVYGSNPLWNDRFAMAAMFGAAMLWAGVVHWLVQNSVQREFIFSLLIALSIGLNLRTQLDFRNGWEKQQDFYWQLLWRAPYIDPGTLIISDGEFLPFMGSYPTGFAINTIYPQTLEFPKLSYWVSNNQEHLPDWDEFRSGSPLSFAKYASSFTGNTADSLTISYLPGDGQCLWVLPPGYAHFPFLSAGVRETIPVSAIDRIHSEPLIGSTPPVEILGPPPSTAWCYYFEKADLAAQSENWTGAILLLEEAQAQGLSPGHGVEFFPFIRAYAMLGQWKDAVRLTTVSSKLSERMTAAVCDFWSRIQMETPDAASRQDAFRQINDRFGCGL